MTWIYLRTREMFILIFGVIIYPGNRVTSNTLSDMFNNSPNFENFSSLWSKGLLFRMSIVSSISWIVTPNTLYLSGCFYLCCIRLHHPSYDLQWSCIHLHLPEWDIVVNTYYHRYCDWQLTDQGWKKWDVCNPRMSVVGTSRYGIRSILCRHIHFPRFLVLLRHFCTISDTHLPNHRCYRCEWYEDVSIDHRWDWVSWVPHPVSTWGCMPW